MKFIKYFVSNLSAGKSLKNTEGTLVKFSTFFLNSSQILTIFTYFNVAASDIPDI